MKRKWIMVSLILILFLAGMLAITLHFVLLWGAASKKISASPQSGWIEMNIINPLNMARTDEPFEVPIANLGLPANVNPESFRIIDTYRETVPYQLDNLTLYGYDSYLVFPVTVAASSNATYYLNYSKEPGLSPPSYAPAVPITETPTNYMFTAENYSGIISKSNGIMENISTTHSGILLSDFGASSIGAVGWAYGWYQNSAKTTLVDKGPVRSIVVAQGNLVYTPQPNVGPSNWTFTTVYFIYKDRVEAMTRQNYVGTGTESVMQVRVTIDQPSDWMLNGNATLDTPPAPFIATIQNPYAGYANIWRDYTGDVWDIYPSNTSLAGLLRVKDALPCYPSYGKWADLTSANGTFGYGVIFSNSTYITRLELQDGRSYKSNTLSLAFIQLYDYTSSTIVPPAPHQLPQVPPIPPLTYDWTLLPHEGVNYTYTEAEAEKAYHPLSLYATPAPVMSPDTVAPTIGGVVQNQIATQVNPGETADVTAMNVIDNVAVDKVLLMYSVDNMTFNSVTMTLISGTNNYMVQIPGEAAGAYVAYTVYANDTSGNRVETSVYAYRVMIPFNFLIIL